MEGSSRGRIGGPAALLALVAVLCAPAPAHAAITRAQANAIALRALAPQQETGRVVVYTLRKALKARDVVFQANPRARRRIRFRRPGRARWFFWMDLMQDALFAHPSRAVTIDAATGRVLQKVSFSWYPVVNGRKPPYLRSTAAYHSPRWQIYSNVRRPLRAARVAARGYAGGPIQVPRSRFVDDCLLTVGDTSAQFRGGRKAMRQFARDVGMRTYSSSPTAAKLRAKVKQLTDGRPPPARDCKDVFLYITGHGNPPPDVDPHGGPAALALKISHDVEGNDVVNESNVLTPAQLEDVMRDTPGAEFKVKIVSCYGGRFIDEIEAGGRPANLKVIETSSNAKRPSFFHLPGVLVGDTFVPNPTDNPYGADEFTNGDVHGLYDWARTADTGPDNGLVEGIVQSFTRGADQDYGRTLPEGAQLPIDDEGGNRADLLRTDPQIRDYRPRPMPMPIGLYVDGKWVFFDPTEIQFQGVAQNRTGTLYRQSGSPVTELRMVVPGGRQVTNQLCPTRLPSAQVTTTTSTNDTLVCSGGNLPLGEAFTLNVRTSPSPSTGMGGQAYARQDGQLKGPFAISGP